MKANKYILLASLAATVPAIAQTPYDQAKILSTDLNGTSRFVGMGGAMSALGGDVSVMHTNPAGTALYRRGDVSVSASINTAGENGKEFDNHSATNFSFDNLGVITVWNTGVDIIRNVNVGVAYQRVRNFNYNYFAHDNKPAGVSQLGQHIELRENELSLPSTDAFFHSGLTNNDGPLHLNEKGQLDYKAKEWGGVQEFDVNLSTNFNDRVYLGISVGLYNLSYHQYQEYAESFEPVANPLYSSYLTSSERRISGNGSDFKMGVILRPVEYSPFRIGLAFSTPVFYKLDNSADFQLDAADGVVYNPLGGYDFDLRTPWKFNFSLGTTVSNILALGAEYEYSDYSTSSLEYGDWDYGYSNVKDDAMNRSTKSTLQGVHTLRLGAEAVIVPGFKVRAGYNYVSSAFRKGAYLNTYAESGVYNYYPNTDFTNTSAINRFTVGLGYSEKNFYCDAAFQYSHQTGDFYAFDNYKLNPTNIKLEKNQFQLTLGYRF